jgi:cytochrome oxidase Cu insertion factor (SCO1/SenC/PrrC family)
VKQAARYRKKAGAVTSLRRKWRWAMRENLRPGEKFPDIELPSEDGKLTKLSSLMGGFPTVVVFSRGHY